MRALLERVAALDLLERLLEAGVHVEADRPHLRLRPAERLTVELREEALRLKPYVLDVLNPPTPDDVCPACGGPFLARMAFGLWECWTCSDRPPEEVHELARIDRDGREVEG